MSLYKFFTSVAQKHPQGGLSVLLLYQMPDPVESESMTRLGLNTSARTRFPQGQDTHPDRKPNGKPKTPSKATE